MATTVDFPPKIVESDNFSAGKSITESAWRDLAGSLNYALATVGMGQILSESYENGELVFSGVDTDIIHTWMKIPKPLKNAMKITVYLKASYSEAVPSAGGPDIIVSTFDTSGVPAGLTDTDSVTVDLEPGPGITEWLGPLTLDVDEGEFFSLRMSVSNTHANKETTIDQYSVAFLPLYEDVGMSKEVVYSPLDSAYGALELADCDDADQDRALAFPLNVDRMSADAPLSAVEIQMIRATLKHLMLRQRIYYLWEGLDYDTDTFGWMYSHYHVSMFPWWVDTEEDGNTDRQIDATLGQLQYLTSMSIGYNDFDISTDETNFMMVVHEPYGNGVNGTPDAVNDMPTHLNDDDELIESYVKLPHGETSKVVRFAEAPPKLAPWVGAIGADRQPITTPEQEVWVNFPANAISNNNDWMRFSVLRRAPQILEEGGVFPVQNFRDLAFLIPWEFINKYYHKGV